MSLLLWMLLGFCAWTLIVLGAGIGVWRWVLIFGGKAAITSFPGDIAHGSAAYRRVVRAHANCLETLPVFAAVVLIAETIHAGNFLMNVLGCAVLGARLVQSSVHILFIERRTTVAVRFSFFAVQFVSIVVMGVLVAGFALSSSHGASRQTAWGTGRQEGGAIMVRHAISSGRTFRIRRDVIWRAAACLS